MGNMMFFFFLQENKTNEQATKQWKMSGAQNGEETFSIPMAQNIAEV